LQQALSDAAVQTMAALALRMMFLFRITRIPSATITICLEYLKNHQNVITTRSNTLKVKVIALVTFARARKQLVANEHRNSSTDAVTLFRQRQRLIPG